MCAGAEQCMHCFDQAGICPGDAATPSLVRDGPTASAPGGSRWGRPAGGTSLRNLASPRRDKKYVEFGISVAVQYGNRMSPVFFPLSASPYRHRIAVFTVRYYSGIHNCQFAVSSKVNMSGGRTLPFHDMSTDDKFLAGLLIVVWNPRPFTLDRCRFLVIDVTVSWHV